MRKMKTNIHRLGCLLLAALMLCYTPIQVMGVGEQIEYTIENGSEDKVITYLWDNTK